jgi:hypothetical protein
MEDELLGGRLISDYIQLGWPRHLPHNALSVFEAVLHLHVEAISGDLSEQPIGSRAGERLAEIGGLNADVFEQQEHELRVFPDEPEEAELLAETRVQLAEYGAQYDLVVRTNSDLAELMRRIGVLQRIEENGDVSWRISDPMPLPSERLPLSAEQTAAEDSVRWQRVHYENAHAIIGLFWKGELDSLSTSLAGLAVRLDIDELSSREAVLALLADGDFTATADIERLPATTPFELRVDWEKFDESRIGISPD